MKRIMIIAVSSLILFSSCDLFNLNEYSEFVGTFERDNPLDFGFWVSESEGRTDWPDNLWSFDFFEEADGKLYRISADSDWEYDSDLKCTIYTSYSIMIIDTDDWSSKLVDPPDSLIGDSDNAKKLRDRPEYYFVEDDVLYWLCTDTEISNAFYAFDASDETWTSLTDFPATEPTVQGADSGFLYYHGLTNLYEYDISSDSWNTITLSGDGLGDELQQLYKDGDTLWGLSNYYDESLSPVDDYLIFSVDLTTGISTHTEKTLRRDEFSSTHKQDAKFYVYNSGNVLTSPEDTWPDSNDDWRVTEVVYDNELYVFDCANPDSGFKKLWGDATTPYINYRGSRLCGDSLIRFGGRRFEDGDTSTSTDGEEVINDFEEVDTTIISIETGNVYELEYPDIDNYSLDTMNVSVWKNKDVFCTTMDNVLIFLDYEYDLSDENIPLSRMWSYPLRQVTQ